MGMQRVRSTFYFLVLVLLVAGCGPAPTSRPVTSDTPVPAMAATAAPTLLPVDLALGRTASASNSIAGNPPAFAIDGDPDTAWRSGAAPEQWLQIDLGTAARITEIRLLVYQVEAGVSRHRLLAGDSPDSLQMVQEFSGDFSDRQELVFQPVIPLRDIRYLRVQTLESPGWVAWREVLAFGEIQETTAVQSQPVADIIYYNAVILTMDPERPTAEAIAIQGERILAVGDRSGISRYQGAGTRSIDLGGLTVTPGFIDSHQHRIGDRWLYGDPPPPLEEVLYEVLREGWTSIHELWVDQGRLEELTGLANAGALPVRVSMYLKMNSEYAIDNWWRAYRPLTRTSPYLQIAGLKITLDREWGQQIFLSDPQVLNDLVRDATSRGWQIATHSFSPQANQLILDAYEYALGGGSNADLRLRIEHLGTMTDVEMQQMASLGILGSVQFPGTGSWPDDASFQTQIPVSLVEQTGPWRDLIDAGVILFANTDAPWCCTPWRQNLRGPGDPPTVPQAIYQGMTRTNFSGRAAETWQTAQVVTAQEALEMLTIRGAYAAHQEDEIGSLAPGKYADLVILSGDPLTTPVGGIPDLVVVQTMVGGRVGYCASGYGAVCAATSGP